MTTLAVVIAVLVLHELPPWAGWHGDPARQPGAADRGLASAGTDAASSPSTSPSRGVEVVPEAAFWDTERTAFRRRCGRMSARRHGDESTCGLVAPVRLRRARGRPWDPSAVASPIRPAAVARALVVVGPVVGSCG